MGAVKNEREIVGAGTAEACWRASARLQELPEAAAVELVPAEARLVVVAPHPDDEVIACGGLLAMHVAAGGQALVVIASDGGASHAGCSDWPGERLVAARRTESEQGLALLGVGAGQTVRLQLPDGQVAAQADRLQQQLARLLQTGDCVLTTWRLDGHPDHEATGEAVARACRAGRCHLLEAPVWAWHWAAPDDARLPWPRMRRLPLSLQVSELKQQALACHRSQLEDRGGGAGPVLGPSSLARVARPFEVYLV